MTFAHGDEHNEEPPDENGMLGFSSVQKVQLFSGSDAPAAPCAFGRQLAGKHAEAFPPADHCPAAHREQPIVLLTLPPAGDQEPGGHVLGRQKVAAVELANWPAGQDVQPSPRKAELTALVR